MPSPLMVERVVRAILRSFVHAGIIPSYADTAKIEAIPANYTDTEIDAVLSTIAFTTATPSSPTLTTDVIRGENDVHVFVDCDDNNTYVSPRYFRVAEDQTDPPVTNQQHELMSVHRGDVDGTARGPILIVGPNASIATAPRTASVRIGATGAPNVYQGSLTCGPIALNSAAGFAVASSSDMGLLGTSIRFYNTTGTTARGGFSATATNARFHVGDYTGGDSIMLEQSGAVPAENYVLRTERSSGSAIKSIYVRGSEAGTHAVYMIVGGHESTHTPATLGNATFAVVGDNVGLAQNAVYIYDRKGMRTAFSEVFTLKTSALNTDNYYVMRLLVTGVGAFHVDSYGNVRAVGTFTTGPADVAELFPSDRLYLPGTVMTTLGGKCTASTSRAQTNVVGVVSTHPGVEIGEHNLYDTSRAFALSVVPFDTDVNVLTVNAAYTPNMLGTHLWINRLDFVEITSVSIGTDTTTLTMADKVSPLASLEAGVHKTPFSVSLALSGLVPVRCSTEYGSITGDGDLLVSGPNGYAVLAPDPPDPGTILGKAVSPLLVVDDASIEYGMVNVLIALQ